MKAGRGRERSERRAGKTARLGRVSRGVGEFSRAHSRVVRRCSSCSRGWRRDDLRPELTLAVSLITLLAFALCCLEDSLESLTQADWTQLDPPALSASLHTLSLTSQHRLVSLSLIQMTMAGEDVYDQLDRQLNSHEVPLAQRFRALFTLKSLGGDRAIEVIGKGVYSGIAWLVGQLTDGG